MACRAPHKAGVLYITPYATLGVEPTVLAADAILAEDIALAERGEGQVDRIEAESIEPGGETPYLGSYGETLTFSVPVYIPATGQVTDAHYMARIMRACGYAQVIEAGVAEWYRLVTSCENIATGIRPVLVTWAQVDGTIHQLRGCVGTVSISAGEAGQPVMLEVELHGDPVPVIATPSGIPTPAPTYATQGVPLSARNATLTYGDSAAPRALYSVELTPGITAEDQPSQLAASGLDSPLVRQTDSARLALQTVVTSTHAVDMWASFISQDSDSVVWSVTGQAPSPIFEVEAASAFAGRPDLGEQGSARAITVEWLLKPRRSEATAKARAPFIVRLLEPVES
jgi:hypothetical protein